MKQLILIRHGKSSWKDPALTDLKRPLKNRGERNAREMAMRLQRVGLNVEKVFMSPALRVTQTVQLMAEETGFGNGVSEIHPELYTFSYEDLMLFLKAQDDSLKCVALAGHNPAVTDLLNFLTLEEVANIPTCGVAVLDLDLEKWAKLRAGGARLSYYDFPKNDVAVEA